MMKNPSSFRAIYVQTHREHNHSLLFSISNAASQPASNFSEKASTTKTRSAAAARLLWLFPARPAPGQKSNLPLVNLNARTLAL